MMPVSRQTIAGPPADKKTVTHAIGPFCYLSIRFGQPFLYPVDRGRGKNTKSFYRSSRRNGLSNADGATALRDMTAIATMVKMNGSIRNAS